MAKKVWQKIAEARPKNGLLFHYTTFSNLELILKSKQLWASRIQELNDAEEFRHGFDFLKASARSRLISINGDDDVDDYMDVIDSQIKSIINRNVFVTSLSTRGDSLSQWRGYGQKEGVAIAFKYEHLANVCAAHSPRHWLRPCLYTFKRKIRIGEDVAEAELSVKKILNIPPNEFNAWNLVNRFAQFSAFCKHKSFKDEREWRIVIKGLKGVDETESPFAKKPNGSNAFPIDLLIDKKSKIKDIGIHHIKVAPSGSKSCEEVNSLLNHYAVKADFNASKSSIPFLF